MGNSHGRKSQTEMIQEDDDRSQVPQLEQPNEDDHNDESSTSTSVANTVVVADDNPILSLLEFFRQLYDRNKAVFKRIVPLHRETFEEIFNKMGAMEANKRKEKRLIVQRSNSFGDLDSLRLHRFKVKPIDSGGQPPPQPPGGGGGGGGKGGGSSTKPAGSK